MTTQEFRTSFGLASVYALRMLGMFLIYPVLALYTATLPGHQSALWLGLAFGAYGLTQALLQLPLGMLSDHIGRKRVIYGGLLVLAAGSFVAAWAPTVQWLALGRAIQGAGAISAAVTALLADLTREEHRTKAMAMVGVSIGLTFAVSLVLGPLLAHYIGVNGIFVLTGALTLLALLTVRFAIPNPTVSRFHSDAEASVARLPIVLKNRELMRLNFGIFALHASQMAMFVSMPFALVGLGLDKAHHWEMYLPVAVAGFVFMVPAIIYGEKRARLKQVFIASVALMTLAQLGMAWSLSSLWQIALWLTGYFIAFNILEACLPSMISKIAPADSKGTAIGVYNTAQSIGLFLGAAVGGWLYTVYGHTGVYAFTGILMIVWLLVALGMRSPPAAKSVMLPLGDDWQGNAQTLSQRLNALNGVHEAIVINEERVAYLKVAQQGWDADGAWQLIQENI